MMQDDFQGLKRWLPSIKFGLLASLLFLIGCFIYGCLNSFSFWHAYADAGFNSAIAHVMYYGVFAGPVVFVMATLLAKFGLKK